MFKKNQLTMIETLFKEAIKDNEGVEIIFQDIRILAAKVPGGYELMVTDNAGDVLDQKSYKGA